MFGKHASRQRDRGSNPTLPPSKVRDKIGKGVRVELTTRAEARDLGTKSRGDGSPAWRHEGQAPQWKARRRDFERPPSAID